jgi:hypothetical protein
MTNFSIKLEGLGQAPAVRVLWLLAVGNFSGDKTINPACKAVSLEVVSKPHLRPNGPPEYVGALLNALSYKIKM